LRVQQELIAQRFNTSEKRLARVLLLLAGLTDSTKERAEIFRISHEELAEMVGTTRSRISFFINRFSKAGAYRLWRRIARSCADTQLTQWRTY